MAAATALVAPSDKLSFSITLTDDEAKDLFLRIFERASVLGIGVGHASVVEGAIRRAAMAVEAVRSLS